MTDPLDDPLAELSAALDVDPSPEFAARVRTGIASETRVRHWRWAFGAVVAVAAVVLTMWLRQPEASDTAGAPQLVVSADGTMGLRFDGSGVRLVRPEPAEVATVGRRGDVGRSAMTRSVSRPEPETLIAPDQAIAFQRLVRLVYEGRIVARNPDWPKTSSLEPVEPPADVTVPPVEVKPVVIDPLIIDTMSNQEG